MKPDWKDSPAWANHLAQDSDGTWYWFKNEPDCNISQETWDGCVRDFEFASDEEDSNPNEFWYDTLESRPVIK